MSVPGYWMNETSGVLRPVVERFLDGKVLDVQEIATMRAYLRQWMAGDFRGKDIDRIRSQVDQIVDMPTLRIWIENAVCAGIDPL